MKNSNKSTFYATIRCSNGLQNQKSHGVKNWGKNDFLYGGVSMFVPLRAFFAESFRPKLTLTDDWNLSIKGTQAGANH